MNTKHNVYQHNSGHRRSIVLFEKLLSPHENLTKNTLFLYYFVFKIQIYDIIIDIILAISPTFDFHYLSHCLQSIRFIFFKKQMKGEVVFNDE